MIRIFGLSDFPVVRGPFDLEREIVACLKRVPLQLSRGDILVIAHKIISKAEGRIVDLRQVEVAFLHHCSNPLRRLGGEQPGLDHAWRSTRG